MTNVMATNLGRKWWFVGGLGGASALLTLPLLHAAGLPSPDTWAQWLVYFLCYGGVWKFLEFVSWFAFVLLAPSSKLLDPARRQLPARE